MEGPKNPTNETLRQLIGLLGFDIGAPGDLRGGGVAFFTNAVLCLKDGGLQAAVRDDWFSACGGFLRQQVEIVSPKVLVCLGHRAYNAVARAFEFVPLPFRAAVESSDGKVLPIGTRVFPRYHCGKRIQNTHRSLEMQQQDWLRLRTFL